MTVEHAHSLRSFLLAHLSERGPGASIEALVLKLRRNGFKEADLRYIIRVLRTEGTVEQIGQYLWLTIQKEEPCKIKKYHILSPQY